MLVPVTNEKSRLTIEKDLIEQWKPVCNTQFGLGDIYTGRYEAGLLSEFSQCMSNLIAILLRTYNGRHRPAKPNSVLVRPCVGCYNETNQRHHYLTVR